MSAVGKVVGGVTKGLFGGGGSKTTSSVNVAPRSKEEQLLLEQLLAAAAQQPDTSNVGLSEEDLQIQSLFKKNLSQFLAKKPDGGIDPNALKSATAFIDETFTKPAEQQLDLATSDYLAKVGAQQSALGRQVSDAAFQENLFKSLANQRAQLGAQRGQNIAGLTQELQFNQPIAQLQAGLQGIGGLGQMQQQRAFAPAFMNDLNQQAFRNRAALLNQLSGERFSAAGTTQRTSGPSKGLLGNLTAIGSFGKDITDQGGLTGIAKAVPGAVKGFFGV